MMLVLLAGIAVSVTACNTIEGAGKEVRNTGQASENDADKRNTY
jgi:predicted small secreted protein